LVNEIILYYDARSKKYQIAVSWCCSLRSVFWPSSVSKRVLQRVPTDVVTVCFLLFKVCLFLFCLQRRPLRFVSVFGKTLSRDSNDVVVFPFRFHVQIQRPLKPALISPSCCMIMNHPEHHLLCASSRYRSRCFRRLGIVYWRFLTLIIAFRLVPTLLDCPAWDTLLVAVLPPTLFCEC